MDSFWVGAWLHRVPQEAPWVDGRRCIIEQLCFGPLETWAYGITQDDQCFREHHIVEGIQEGEHFVDDISMEDMLKAIEAEIDLCRKYQAEELISVLQTEKRKTELLLTGKDWRKCTV